ncbi:MAG: transcriptional regulator, partial [Paramuribaculum sp.]|nr:transcriptional regulator [Paramuribaculum sp.]
KMMGDYVIYLNDKCVITACDNIAFIKKLPCIDHFMTGAETGHAYPGAKESYILSFENQPEARQVIQTLWDILPFPKKR